MIGVLLSRSGRVTSGLARVLEVSSFVDSFLNPIHSSNPSVVIVQSIFPKDEGGANDGVGVVLEVMESLILVDP